MRRLLFLLITLLPYSYAKAATVIHQELLLLPKGTHSIAVDIILSTGHKHHNHCEQRQSVNLGSFEVASGTEFLIYNDDLKRLFGNDRTCIQIDYQSGKLKGKGGAWINSYNGEYYSSIPFAYTVQMK